MANKNWKVGDKVIIETVPLKSNTYTNLSGVVTEVKPDTNEIGVATEGISEADIVENCLHMVQGKPTLWFDDRASEVKKQPAGKKNMLCIECAILYHADIEDMPEGGCPECGEDTPLVNQLPLSWIRDVLVTLVDAISNE